MSLCLVTGGVMKALHVAAFTLVWTHSVERVDWQEDWRVSGGGLQLVEARVKGSGAGMEPPSDAKLIDGWWRWSPDSKLPHLVLGNSGEAGEWRICTADSACQSLSVIFGQQIASPVTIVPCSNPKG